MLEPTLPDRGAAIFFDFDGTLVNLAPRPEDVSVDPGLPGLLAQLALSLEGAVAIVSGRPVAEIDHHLQPLTLPVAGVHGAERRGSDQLLRRIAVQSLDEAAALIAAFCQRHPGLRMEHKPGAIALHYRSAEALEDECLAVMSQALQRVEGMALLRGKKVVEMKPRRAGKGMAVKAFLEERPFSFRQPWFFGDDMTDEAAFEVVQALGGIAVKIGEGDTLAAHRLPDPAAMHAWIVRAVAQWAPASPQKVTAP